MSHYIRNLFREYQTIDHIGVRHPYDFEDVAAVKDSFKKMLENGLYKADLFSDL